MSYRTRSRTVEALQVGTASRGQLRAFLASGEVVSRAESDEAREEDESVALYIAEATDWLVKAGNEIWVESDRSFTTLYEEAP
jgi:hypothetical protein